VSRARTAFLVTAVATIVLVAGLFGWEGRLRDEFEARVEALRASGEPVAMADLAPPPIPEERNAAPLLLEARWRFDVLGTDPALLWSYDRDDWTAEQWSEIAVWVEAARPFGEVLDRALDRPECRFDLRWEDGPAMVVEMIPIAQHATLYLDYRAQVEARRGDAEAAVRSLARIHDLAAHIRANSSICALVRWTVEGVAAETLRRVAEGPGFSAARARAVLDPRFRDAERTGSYLDAVRAERTLAVWMTRRWLDGTNPFEVLGFARQGPAPGFLLNHRPLKSLAYPDGVACLDLLDEAAALDAERWPGAHGRAGHLVRRAEAMGDFHMVTRLVAPVLPALVRARFRHAAKLRLARVGLAVLAGGERWPERLPEGLPLDPFTDGPFRYERTASGVRIEAAAPVEHEDERIFWELRGEDGER
jgi:hypothetical protein